MKILKLFLLAIIFFLMFISCKEELKNNYQFVESVLNNPDVLDSLLSDTSKVTKHYFNFKIKNDFINNFKKIINEDFKKNGFVTEKDYTIKHLNPNTHKFNYMCHTIKFVSKKTDRILMFDFTTEDNGIWKFDYLTDYDYIEKGPFLP